MAISPSRMILCMPLGYRFGQMGTSPPEPYGPHGWILPHHDTAFLFNANLMDPGTLLLDMATLNDELGIAPGNEYRSIFSTPYLYKLLLETGLSDIPSRDGSYHRATQGRNLRQRHPNQAQGYISAVCVPHPAHHSSRYSEPSQIIQGMEPQPYRRYPALRRFFEIHEDLPRVLSGLSA